MAIFPGSAIPSAADDAYTIDNSLRFETGDSAYLSRTPGSASNRKTWTISCWVKPTVGTNVILLAAGSNPNYIQVYFTGAGALAMYDPSAGGGSNSIYIRTTRLLRDPSAWYHIVMQLDTTVSTPETDRVKMYVNNERADSFDQTDWPDEDYESFINNNIENTIGNTGSSYSSCYQAEYYFIDGTALTPSSFGELSSTTNQWKPLDSDTVKDAVTFGTNGFYQKYGGTELATSFEDSADHTIHTITPSGSVHTDTTIKKVGTASAQFDGTGDYLTAGNSGDWNLSNEDFTLEWWFYRTESGETAYFFETRSADPFEEGWEVDGNNGRTIGFYDAGGLGDLARTSAISDDAWHHVAFVRNGTTITSYVDGTADGSSSVSTTAIQAGSQFRVGTRFADAGGEWYDFTGYIDEVRLSIGIARYTANFTTFGQGGGTIASPTAFTADKYTRLLLHMDGSDSGTTFTDSSWTSAPRHTITPEGGVTNTRAVRKIGDSSIYFDGTGDYLELPDSPDWQLGGGTGDFTWETWIYPTDTVSEGRFLGQRSDDNNRWSIELYLGKINFYMKSGGSVVGSFLETDTGAVTQDQWNHVAFVRSGSTPYIFVDGVSVAVTTSVAFGTMVDVPSTLTIGKYYSGSSDADDYEGYMDEIRISNNARYTSTFTTFGQGGGTIANPTPFTADANTKLLIHSNWDGGLGADSSGNYNTFAITNLVATDQMLDTPTNNFCTFNPLAASSDNDLTEGNLKVAGTGGAWKHCPGTIGVSSGKWYWEGYVGADGSSYPSLQGITDSSTNIVINALDIGYYYRSSSGNKYALSASDTSYGASFTTGDIIGVALDLDSGTQTITFYKNNATQGAITITRSASWLPDTMGVDQAEGSTPVNLNIANFGSDSSFAGTVTAQGNQDGNGKGDFYYAPPTDYLALCTKNLSDPEIALPGEYFNTILYDDGAGAKTGVGFQPDLVWVKSRGSAYDSKLTDAIRGVTKALVSNDPGVAQTTDSTGLTAFGADGFTVGADTDYSDTTGTGMVAWNWKGDGVSGGTLNEDGTEDSYVNVNTTAGFSIVKYVGTGAIDTFGHGLAEAPELIIAKDTESTAAWRVAGDSIPTAWHYVMYLSQTPGAGDDGTQFNDTPPSPSVFTLGTGGDINAIGNVNIAYCFHSVEGYSKIGNYTGNASADGTFVYCGFRPAFLIAKNYGASGKPWVMYDDKRDTYNEMYKQLLTNSSAAANTSEGRLDFVSNGIKWRIGDSYHNDGSFMYIAFASNPFKTANAR